MNFPGLRWDNFIFTGLGRNQPKGIFPGWGGTMVYFRGQWSTAGASPQVYCRDLSGIGVGQWSIAGIWLQPAHRYISRIFPRFGPAHIDQIKGKIRNCTNLQRDRGHEDIYRHIDNYIRPQSSFWLIL